MSTVTTNAGRVPMLEAEISALRAAARQSALAAQAADAQALDAMVQIAVLRGEMERLTREAERSERRAIAFGNIVHMQVLAMRAAVVAARIEGDAAGMRWIVNGLCGPGHLPDVDAARALGGAQALFDKEVAEHEAFRAAHPAPDYQRPTPQHVLKAEPLRADATDRGCSADASPGGGPMGAGQPTAVGPAGWIDVAKGSSAAA